MKKSAAAALILMVLLFGGAYLTATEPDAPAPETPQAQGDGEVVLTIKTGEAAEADDAAGLPCGRGPRRDACFL